MRSAVLCVETKMYDYLHVQNSLQGFIEGFDSMCFPTSDARQMVFETPNSD